MKNRLLDISFLTVFGTLLVVFGHSLPSRYSYQDEAGLLKIIEIIYIFHMPLFFYISGFLSSIKEESLVSLLKGRARRLLLPYFVLSVLAYIVKCFFGGASMRPVDPGVSDLLFRLFYPWENPVIYYWFLPTLFFVSILAFFVKRANASLSIVIFLLAVLANMQFSHQSAPPSFINYTGVLHNFIFYFIGVQVGRFSLKWASKLCVSLIAGLMSLVFAVSLLPAVFAIFLLHALADLMSRVEPLKSFPAKIQSYPIYLFSFYVQVPCSFIANQLTSSSIAVSAISVFCGFFMLNVAYTVLVKIRVVDRIMVILGVK